MVSSQSGEEAGAAGAAARGQRRGLGGPEPRLQRGAVHPARPHHTEVVQHHENPSSVGSVDKTSKNVGT